MLPDKRAWAEIDLAAFRSNLRTARSVAEDAEVWPVLKANGYGHGAERLARVCAASGVVRIGVGDSSEALQLRDAGIATPLLVLGTVIDAEVPALLRHDVEVGIHSESRVRMLGLEARRAGRRLGVHLKVDTGMTRLGVRPEALLRVARAIDEEPGLQLRGLMTHFAGMAGACEQENQEQFARFRDACSTLDTAGIHALATHCANSAALFTGLRPLGDAVRPGIALFGLLPAETRSQPLHPAASRLQPVLSLRAQIVFLKDIRSGNTVGYGRRWKAWRPARVATLPIGYADGVPWRLGLDRRAAVLVRGQRCPVVGAVSMDYCSIDVTAVPGVRVGETATLIGTDRGRRITVEDVAAWAGTVPYEVSCSLGSRVVRVYRDQQLEKSGAASG